MKSFRKLNPISARLGSARLGSARLGVAVAACLLVGVAHASNKPSEPADLDPSQFTALADGIPHPTVGCDGAVVLTPRPGTEFADPLGTLPDSATSFFAKAASLHMRWASTLRCTHTGDTHWPGSTEPSAPMPSGPNPDAGQVTPTYAGYRIRKTSHYVQSGWTIPTVVNPPPGHHYSPDGYYASSTWAGMGGGTDHHMADLPLIQAGTRQNWLASNSGEYYFWYEIVGGPSNTGEVEVYSPVAHPGDDTGTVSIWLAESDSVEFGLCDFSDNTPPGGCAVIDLDCDPNDPTTCTQEPGGNTTEWVVEAPSPGYGSYPLADFGEVNFYNGCWATTFVNGAPVNCRAISDTGVTALSLQQYVFQQYQILASPGQITSGSSFTDLYYLPDNGN
ncbi:MAG: G1 family glutamic endopeptidase [Rhodanobacteraceae bacterium]